MEADKVLNAARVLGIDPVSGVFLADSDSLISQLLNRVDNADQLKDLENLNIPDELACPITHQIMTDPVYSEANPARFERAAILEWLNTRKIDPCTTKPLSPSHLKRDFKLKIRADLFVEDKLKEKQNSKKHTQMSLFKTKNDGKTELYTDENGFMMG